jgi:integration host factor subunit beta
MTRAELVEHVTKISSLSKKHAEIVVNTVFDAIIEALRADEKIELRGFGSFRIRRRQSRVGRNPKTGERVDVPAKRIPYFKPGKELKELINSETGGDTPASAPQGQEPSSEPSTPDSGLVL